MKVVNVFSSDNITGSSKDIFRFYLRSEPKSLDPAQFWGSETSYLFSQLFHGLYRYDHKKGLVPAGAKKCVYVSDLKIECELNPKVKYNNGQQVKAADYVKAFRHLLNPETKSRDNAHLIRIENARKVLLSKLPVEKIGIESPSDFKLVFSFEEPDFEFLEKLSSASLVPWLKLPDIKQAESIISNGPYSIKSFIRDQKVILTPNPYYPFGNPNRPEVEIVFVNDDITAQNLFDSGRIDFIHRMDVALTSAYRNHPGIYKVNFSRFDYIGFGPKIQDSGLAFRKALVQSLNYSEITKIFNTGRFGCIGLSENLIVHRECYDYKPNDIQLLKKEFPSNYKNHEYKFKISQTGGDNLLRISEWYENQWKRFLGIKISIEPQEQGMYLQTLKLNTPDIFRKGINLDRPTCLSALEEFHSKSESNFIKYANFNYDKKIDELARTRDFSKRKKICTEAIKILMDDYRIIPQGIVQYTMLSNQKFKNVNFNEINQLDLSYLEKVK